MISRLNQVKGEHIPMKVCCLKCFICTDSSDEQTAFDGLQKITICSFISFLRLQLNEFPQSEIKQKLSSVQKVICITAIADKKTISAFLVSASVVLPTSVCCSIKCLVSSGWLSFLLEFTMQEKKVNQFTAFKASTYFFFFFLSLFQFFQGPQ